MLVDATWKSRLRNFWKTKQALIALERGMRVMQWWTNDMRSRVEPGFCQFMAKIGWTVE